MHGRIRAPGQDLIPSFPLKTRTTHHGPTSRQGRLHHGSASGIGKEIALLFAQEGAKIVIADLNKAAADATAAELAAGGAQAIGVGVDVTDEAQVNASVEEAVAAFGGIDILISNAGIQIVHPVEEFSFAD